MAKLATHGRIWPDWTSIGQVGRNWAKCSTWNIFSKSSLNDKIRDRSWTIDYERRPRYARERTQIIDDEWLPSAIYLVDQSPQIAHAWRNAFASIPEATALEGDYFQRPADAIVSPANSFGIMDGGLDLALRDRAGAGVQHKLQSVIVERHHGELPVGQAEIVETANSDWPYMVAAPTMRVPEIVAHSINAYLAFRAILLAIENFNRAAGTSRIRTLVCCGLCTGVGAMPAERSAGQMYLAYKAMLLPAKIGRFESIHQFHKSLRSL